MRLTGNCTPHANSPRVDKRGTEYCRVRCDDWQVLLSRKKTSSGILPIVKGEEKRRFLRAQPRCIFSRAPQLLLRSWTPSRPSVTWIDMAAAGIGVVGRAADWTDPELL
ncbi:hypothetical protein PHSY_006888 [Pseudozyma hubeiensis SY62]|uniref:Uncharacterized protein n=1 Tax=Pseudozyma hubeiensis (strain SY62) TaxID=1305764 RepID=R9PDH3_PSEHS|nr:hypothetical protein PHSY_006888 [Pseudozyma hubeiensis SY62]GAC99287.1 hypothetical protein PHSY_006888 [Pseudozyma hubeiensis SY62]